jgi:hypothetical protein
MFVLRSVRVDDLALGALDLYRRRSGGGEEVCGGDGEGEDVGGMGVGEGVGLEVLFGLVLLVYWPGVK